MILHSLNSTLYRVRVFYGPISMVSMFCHAFRKALNRNWGDLIKNASYLCEGADGIIWESTGLLLKKLNSDLDDAGLTLDKEAFFTKKASDLGVGALFLRYAYGTIAMTKIEGKSLYQLLREGLPQEQLASIMSKLCSKLEILHNAGIVHCDIHYNNVIVDDEGEVWIIDYGCAKWGSDSMKELEMHRILLNEEWDNSLPAHYQSLGFRISCGEFVSLDQEDQ